MGESNATTDPLIMRQLLADALVAMEGKIGKLTDRYQGCCGSKRSTDRMIASMRAITEALNTPAAL